ncbi:DUF3800 domain-containing protein [Phyllobacterium sp. K27]
MIHSYVAYIDESGDDGLDKFRSPGGKGGASSWLVISACIFRQAHSLEAVKWRDEISSKIPEKKSRSLHFAELNHNQKVVVTEVLATKPIRVLSVLTAKKTIPKGIYTEKNQLYFYMTRYLIERMSWMCRDLRPQVPEGDGRVAITFSRRGGMSYQNFRSYLGKLREAKSDDVKIHWPVIDIDSVDAQDHAKSASLQLVDVAASAFASAVEPNIYGNCEMRYARNLKPITYHRKGNYLSYGIKLVPKYEDCSLNGEQMNFIAQFQ